MDYFCFIYSVAYKLLYYINYIFLYTILWYLFRNKVVPILYDYYNYIITIHKNQDISLFEEEKQNNKLNQSYEKKVILYGYHKDKLLMYIQKKNNEKNNIDKQGNSNMIYKMSIENKILTLKKEQYEKLVLRDKLSHLYQNKSDIAFLSIFFKNEFDYDEK